MASSQCYELIECFHVRVKNNCKLCGVFVKEGVAAFKTERYRNTDEAYTVRYLKSLKRMARKPLAGKYPFSESLYSYLERLVEKFEFGMETLALVIYLFNHLYEKRRCDKDFEEKMNLYAGVCVMIAAKGVDLDKKVPYYSRFQRHADAAYSKSEYEQLEGELLAEIEFDIQIPTFVTFLNYYLSNGLLFSDDPLNKRSAFIIEEKVKELTFKALKSGDYISRNQEKLAASIVLRARKECRLGWNPLITEYSLMSAAEFQDEVVLHSIPLQTTNNSMNTSISHSINHSLSKVIEHSLSKPKNIIVNTRPQPILNSRMKYVHSRSVNSSMGIMSLRPRNL